MAQRTFGALSCDDRLVSMERDRDLTADVRARVSALEADLDRLYELRTREAGRVASIDEEIAKVRESILSVSRDPRASSSPARSS